jgi:hypothetical protein
MLSLHQMPRLPIATRWHYIVGEYEYTHQLKEHMILVKETPQKLLTQCQYQKDQANKLSGVIIVSELQSINRQQLCFSITCQINGSYSNSSTYQIGCNLRLSIKKHISLQGNNLIDKWFLFTENQFLPYLYLYYGWNDSVHCLQKQSNQSSSK